MPHVPLIFIIAGEASGDQLGAELMASLKEIKDVRFAGIGGPAMTAQGLTSLFPMEELSLIGIVSILRQLPHLLRRLNYTFQMIQLLKPDIVVTIDAQEFSFRILKRLHKLSSRPRLIHYVAPTVWAYRAGRARKISKIADHLLCLYPFEPPYFEKYGLKTTFVGHPVAREQIPSTDRKQSNLSSSHVIPAKAEIQSSQKELNNLSINSYLCENDHREEINEIDSNSRVTANRNPDLLCLLPGSRRSEIEVLLPIFGQAASLLKQDLPSLKIVIPTLPSIKYLVTRETKKWPFKVDIVVGNDARKAVFQNASVALAASGTVALQLAAASLPFIIAYKVDKINEWIGRIILKTPWVCMVNILLAFHKFGPGFALNRNAAKKLKEPWIPELLQDNCTPKKLHAELIKLFKDETTRKKQEIAMEETITLLKTDPRLAAESVKEEMVNKVYAS